MSSCENPNTDKDALMTRRQKFDGQTKICVKCKQNTGNVVVRYAVYCKSCFFLLVQTRFRKVLEPSINAVPDEPRRKALRAVGSLVIGFSGGTSSTALLDLVAKTYFAPRTIGDAKDDAALKGGKDHPRNAEKGIWKGNPAVCYVEVCGAFPGEKDRIEEIREVVGYAGKPFEYIPLRLEDAFDPNWWDRIGGGNIGTSARILGLDLSDEGLRLVHSSSNLNPHDALRMYLSSLPTQTAFYSAIQILIRILLLHTAASRKASHLVLGTSLTALSVNLISGIAQGAGFAVAEEAKEEWNPRPEQGIKVRVLRPMKDIGMKECAIWDWWNGLREHGRGKNAIGALTRDFIYGLESDYPATVSTVARTCAKLTPKEGSNGVCIMCERPAQHGVQGWKARISIRSYHEASSAVSGKSRPPHLTEDEISNLTKFPVNSSSATSNSASLTARLCYACHTLLTSRSSRGTSSNPAGNSSDVPLPLWVHPTIGSADAGNPVDNQGEADEGTRSVKLSRKDMESRIADFLLPDSE
ncbi:hypothetical protein M413DRAFT_446735 [Hebeloma cylindrosporum]|uniref:Cytoplasmic tRNA 2-thiolation protein 2 n=1 Tax=Hebeloma cylindrosporum TaxID=76867 RepID=A0A0C3BT03_HEBCY|nr:hypothetical protein M413DRAFT_446735 [Hebeloma cylindrosporum h7]